ncbi:MAG: hypothetical protein Q8R92_03705 [Deltaproteobacteria bacterium]|nr:hypothetical protein [Deltaproteobacteria bacterium]
MTKIMRMRDNLGRIDPSARIYENVTLGKNVTVREGAILYENVSVGEGGYIGPNVVLGEPLADFYGDAGYENPPTVIGPGAIIRAGTVIYAGSRTGARLRTGHSAAIREFTEAGDDCSFGTFVTVDGRCKLGNGVRLHYHVCLSQGTVMGDRVQVYPYSCLPDSLHPPCRRHLEAPVIGEETVILMYSIVMPRVKVGKRCLIASHTLVNQDVPDGMVAMGSPAKITKRSDEIPCKITPGHHPYPWTEASK